MESEAMWSPVPTTEEIMYYATGRGVSVDYESDVNEWGATVHPVRLRLRPFNRMPGFVVSKRSQKENT